MLRRQELLTLLLIVVIVVLFVDPVYAGPGGAIAKGFFKTWWGKAIGILLAIILLPLIIYVKMREYFAVRKNKKTLLKLGMLNPDFQWLNLQKSVKATFERVYAAWSAEDMERVSEYVSTWYWRNQQLVHLDRWKENNLKNVCNLRKVESIKPLYLQITPLKGMEGSKIAFSIEAEVEDYLINRSTGQVIEGRKGYDGEEKVWIMEYTEGKWLLDDIQEGSLSLTFAKMPNIVPSHIPTESMQKA